ncbi:MAG: GFA family protein [Pseudomonadales bacterium]
MSTTPSPERRSGRCLCGAVRFEAAGPPLWVAYCHCASCRRQTASPVSCYAGYRPADVRFSGSRPKLRSSSPGVRRGFCPRCGTPVSYEADVFFNELHLFTGLFDAPETLQPTRHVFWHERQPGFDVYDTLPRYADDPDRPAAWGPQPALRVLFLCTGNSARSILAEALVNSLDLEVDGEPVIAHSAGSHPAGQINPGALELLARRGIPTRQLASKSWDQFATAEAPPLRWVITLCDAAAGESCPVFPGRVQRLHWGLPDPAHGEATFDATWRALEERVRSWQQSLSGR